MSVDYCPGSIAANFVCKYVSDYNSTSTVDRSRDISVIAIVSSLLSCLGSVLIVYTYARHPSIRSGSRGIITYLAIADFVTAVGYIMGSSNYLQYTAGWNGAGGWSPNSEQCLNLFTPVCKIQSFITTTSSMMSFFWTLILGIYLYMTVVKGNVHLAQQLVPLYHVVAWGAPTVVVFVMLATGILGYAPVASANWCFITLIESDAKRILMIMVGGKFLEIITYVVVIVLYVAIKLHIWKDNATIYHSGNKSKIAVVQQVDKKLTFIPVVFILLRMWGTVEFIVTEVYSKYFCTNNPGLLTTLFILRVLQAIGDGGQGWGNAILYIFSSPKIRGLLFKDLVICCSRTANACHYCKISAKRYDVASSSEQTVKMSVNEDGHTDGTISIH